MEPTTLILCGASVRAAAYSALRAGFAVWCADRFRDADLVALCPEAMRVEDYQCLPALLEQHAPPGPCVFTGALENHPAILAEIGKHRPVWGMEPEVLREVRQPEKLQAALAEGGFPSLEVQLTPPPLTRESVRWLRKPFLSAGGQSISLWVDSRVETNTSAYYWQEYRRGESYSALYLGDGSGSILIGLCQQLIGEPWLHAAPFTYCGNIGPLPMTEEERTLLQSLGTLLAGRFRLRGLFGLDLIQNEESFLITEVNPRYPASAELYELTYQVPLLGWHVAVFEAPGKGERGESAPCFPSVGLEPGSKGLTPPARHIGADALLQARHRTGNSLPCLGKAIIYASEEMVIPVDFLTTFPRRHQPWQLPAYADVPPPGTVIKAGQPVLTFFSEGNDAAACRVALEKESYSLDRLFRCL